MSFDNSPYWIGIHHNTMQYNEAVDGGGICVDMVYRDPSDVGGQTDYYQNTYLNIYNTIWSENIAWDDGGALYVKAGTAYVTNVVMDDNYGASAGTIATKGSPVYVSNSILTDNDGNDVALAEDDIEGDSGSISWTHSSFYDNDGGFKGSTLQHGRGQYRWRPALEGIRDGVRQPLHYETRASVTWMAVAPIWEPLEALQPTGR